MPRSCIGNTTRIPGQSTGRKIRPGWYLPKRWRRLFGRELLSSFNAIREDLARDGAGSAVPTSRSSSVKIICTRFSSKTASSCQDFSAVAKEPCVFQLLSSLGCQHCSLAWFICFAALQPSHWRRARWQLGGCSRNVDLVPRRSGSVRKCLPRPLFMSGSGTWWEQYLYSFPVPFPPCRIDFLCCSPDAMNCIAFCVLPDRGFFASRSTARNFSCKVILPPVRIGDNIRPVLPWTRRGRTTGEIWCSYFRQGFAANIGEACLAVSSYCRRFSGG